MYWLNRIKARLQNPQLIIAPVKKETHKAMEMYADKLHKMVSSPFFKVCLTFHGNDIAVLNKAGDEAWKKCVEDTGTNIGAGVVYSFSCRAVITDPNAPDDDPFALDRNNTTWMDNSAWMQPCTLGSNTLDTQAV